jgi:hypothetical protein
MRETSAKLVRKKGSTGVEKPKVNSRIRKKSGSCNHTEFGMKPMTPAVIAVIK